MFRGVNLPEDIKLEAYDIARLKKRETREKEVTQWLFCYTPRAYEQF